MTGPKGRFVSRGGEKLDAAIEAFDLDVHDLSCADFGCNVGGFTDCLLQRGASRVYAVDTGYGPLAWKLRKDARVIVMERTNALHTAPPETVDLVVCDVAWTPQERVIPAALAWLKPRGRIISLLKPHYELTKLRGRKPLATLTDGQSRDACREVCERLAGTGPIVRAITPSPIRGKGGNVEYLLLVSPGAPPEGKRLVDDSQGHS